MDLLMLRFIATALSGFTLLTGTACANPDPRPPSVTDYGADPTGNRDSTGAFDDATKANQAVSAPCGTFLVNWTIRRKINFSFSGAGSCTILRATDPKRPTIAISFSNFSQYANFAVIGYGGKETSGVVITESDNTSFSGLFVSQFPKNGFECVGGAESSGIKVTDGYFLNNGNSGISFENCQDFFIRNNNLGKNTTAGIMLINSNAGQIEGNYIWENGTAIIASKAQYDWFSKNRLTQSKYQGLVCNECRFLNIVDNQSYQNSLSESLAFSDWDFHNTKDLIFSNNLVFDWTGVAHTSYGIALDENCENVILSNNIFSHHGVSSTRISPKALKISISGNRTPE